MGRELYVQGDRDDVRRRLVDTICMYKGEPVYVSSNRGHVLDVYDLNKNPLGKIDYRSKEFDYRSVRVGYMNFSNQAWYIQRLPLRSNAVWGISAQNLSSSSGRPPTTWGKEMISCIKGKHPSLPDAINNVLKKGWGSCAFHRHFAVSVTSSGLNLLHRDSPVAVYNVKTQKFEIVTPRANKTLKILLDEAGVPYT